MDSLLGGYFTVSSIVVVFQVFVMQQWLEKISRVEVRAREAIQAGVRSTAMRSCRFEMDRIQAGFPAVQAGIFSGATFLLSMGAFRVALSLEDIPRKLSMAPTGVLLAVALVVPLVVRLDGRRRLLEVEKGLPARPESKAVASRR